jgi:hypothetical protein
VAWLAGRLATARLLPWPLVRIGLFGIAAAVILKVVVLPSFRDTTVIETFPVAAPAPAAPSPTNTPSTSTSAAPSPTSAAPTATSAAPAPASAAPGTTAPATPAAPAPTDAAPGPAAPAPTDAPPDTAVPAAPDTAAPDTSAPAATPPAPAASVSSPTEPVTTVATAPVRLRTGSFTGIDHRAEGTVNLYRQPDGSYVVGLEDIDIQPGPDYDVYVVPGADREGRDGATRLDDLRGNRGTQFYEVPAGLALEDGPWTVLVWCQTFGVPVANATPA